MEEGYSDYDRHVFYKQPELSEWSCHLFGADDYGGITWTPPKGSEPNWFWRKMQYIILGNRWGKTGGGK